MDAINDWLESMRRWIFQLNVVQWIMMHGALGKPGAAVLQAVWYFNYDNLL